MTIRQLRDHSLSLAHAATLILERFEACKGDVPTSSYDGFGANYEGWSEVRDEDDRATYLGDDHDDDCKCELCRLQDAELDNLEAVELGQAVADFAEAIAEPPAEGLSWAQLREYFTNYARPCCHAMEWVRKFAFDYLLERANSAGYVDESDPGFGLALWNACHRGDWLLWWADELASAGFAINTAPVPAIGEARATAAAARALEVLDQLGYSYIGEHFAYSDTPTSAEILRAHSEACDKGDKDARHLLTLAHTAIRHVERQESDSLALISAIELEVEYDETPVTEYHDVIAARLLETAAQVRHAFNFDELAAATRKCL